MLHVLLRNRFVTAAAYLIKLGNTGKTLTYANT